VAYRCYVEHYICALFLCLTLAISKAAISASSLRTLQVIVLFIVLAHDISIKFLKTNFYRIEAFSFPHALASIYDITDAFAQPSLMLADIAISREIYRTYSNAL